MKTLITARFDKTRIPLLETITTDYSFAGYGVTGIKMPVPEMKKAIQGIELLITEFEDINEEVIEAADRLKIIVCCRNEAFASIDIEAATKKKIPVLRRHILLPYQGIYVFYRERVRKADFGNFVPAF